MLDDMEINEAASIMGKKGGPARAKSLTKQQRHDISSKAARSKKGMKYKKKGVLPKYLPLM